MCIVPQRSKHFTGLTLFEMVVVLTILMALSAIVVPALSRRMGDARLTVTQHSLQSVRDAVANGYYQDQFERLPLTLDASRVFHPQLVYLFVNPSTYGSVAIGGGLPTLGFDPFTKRGWNGPYLQAGVGTPKYAVDTSRGFTRLYGEDGDATAVDGWGQPIVLQQPISLTDASYSTDLRVTRVVSAGPNGVLETPPDVLYPSAAQIGDDVILLVGASL